MWRRVKSGWPTSSREARTSFHLLLLLAGRGRPFGFLQQNMYPPFFPTVWVNSLSRQVMLALLHTYLPNTQSFYSCFEIKTHEMLSFILQQLFSVAAHCSFIPSHFPVPFIFSNCSSAPSDPFAVTCSMQSLCRLRQFVRNRNSTVCGSLSFCKILFTCYKQITCL